MPLKVLIIDDHTLFRVGLEGLLESRGIVVVASTGEGQGCLKLVTELTPDIILLDMRMPRLDGLSVLKQLRQNKIQIPIVMLTTSTDETDLVESLRSGAQGYLLKDMAPDDLVLALRDIVSGKTVVAPDLAPILAKAVQGKPESDTKKDSSPFSALTPRETEILALLAEGQSNKAIARNLGISDGTVKLHVKAILRKLNLHSRVEAAVMAVEYGIPRKNNKGPKTNENI
jgi:two-component system nitrate/nitrite response regulator NarL